MNKTDEEETVRAIEFALVVDYTTAERRLHKLMIASVM